MSKCVYCNKNVEIPHPLVVEKDVDVVTCCSDECVNKTREFSKFANRSKPLFLIGIILSVGIVFCGVFIEMFTQSISMLSILMACGLAFMGLTIIIFPLATPETFSMFGIKKTVVFTRILGIVVIAIAPLLALFIMSP